MGDAVGSVVVERLVVGAPFTVTPLGVSERERDFEEVLGCLDE